MLSTLAKRRIKQLADFMEALPPKAEKHFNMEDWVDHSGDHKHFGAGKILGRNDFMTCGTVACALGWATAVPAFKRAGLGLKWNGDRNSTEILLKDRVESSYNVFGIAEDFFDISHSEAVYLFRDIPATTPKQWAKMARSLLRTWSV